MDNLALTASSWSARVAYELLARWEKATGPGVRASSLTCLHVDGPSVLRAQFRTSHMAERLGVELTVESIPQDHFAFTCVTEGVPIGRAVPAALAFDVQYLLVEEPHPREFYITDDSGVRWIRAF